jgi:hypothetical protein
MISRKSTMAIADAYAVRFRSLPTYGYARTKEHLLATYEELEVKKQNFLFLNFLL